MTSDLILQSWKKAKNEIDVSTITQTQCIKFIGVSNEEKFCFTEILNIIQNKSSVKTVTKAEANTPNLGINITLKTTFTNTHTPETIIL
jgi:hypothetical protein